MWRLAYLAILLPLMTCAQSTYLSSGTTLGSGVSIGGAPPPSINFQNTNQQTTIGTATGDWKPVCILPGCNPGGTGTPSATSQTFGIASPSTDGKAMKLSMTADANSTNALWVFLAGSCDSCTNVTSNFEVYLPSNASSASSFEFDQFIFDKTQLYNLMWGSQCATGGDWQIASATSSWVNTTVPCSLSLTTWHTIQWQVHRIAGDVSCAGGLPKLYWGTLTIDGTANAVNMSMCASALPSTYASQSGHQFQIDIPTASSTSPVTINEYIDQSSFQASVQ